jgi:hypothetical protein
LAFVPDAQESRAYTRECYVGSNGVAAPSFRKVPKACLAQALGTLAEKARNGS